MPVTTFHTVLPTDDDEQRYLVSPIAKTVISQDKTRTKIHTFLIFFSYTKHNYFRMILQKSSDATADQYAGSDEP
jgi:hypothetical protein